MATKTLIDNKPPLHDHPAADEPKPQEKEDALTEVDESKETKEIDGHDDSEKDDGDEGTDEDNEIKVTIVVVAVPEWLPLAVTSTLAYSVRKMMADKALVRRLSSCETMGSSTTICSDKTDTLTMNQMIVVEVYAGGSKIDPPHQLESSPKLRALLIEGVAQNTNGSVYVPEGANDVEVSGSPKEKAILHWALKVGMNFVNVQSKSSILHVFPFNSEKKRGGVAIHTADSVHIHWKGAAEIVLACCTGYIDRNDQLVQIDEEMV